MNLVKLTQNLIVYGLVLFGCIFVLITKTICYPQYLFLNDDVDEENSPVLIHDSATHREVLIIPEEDEREDEDEMENGGVREDEEKDRDQHILGDMMLNHYHDLLADDHYGDRAHEIENQDFLNDHDDHGNDFYW